jgi:hypothetical protein
VGAIQIPPMSSVVEEIVSRYGVKTFIETGTYQGSASHWAGTIFEKVLTIEMSPQFYSEAQSKLAPLHNVEMFLGDSAKVLNQLVPRMTAPCCFWLDAHSGGGNFGDEDYCPLLAELDAINQSDCAHFIFIDDARAFVAPVPPPFKWKCWPPIDRVIRALQFKFSYNIAILNDAIIAIPPDHEEFFAHMSTVIRPSI